MGEILAPVKKRGDRISGPSETGSGDHQQSFICFAFVLPGKKPPDLPFGCFRLAHPE